MGKEKNTAAYRILDANLNRAVEGVRVVEDMLRFFGNDADAADALRNIRHRLRAGAKLLPGGPNALLASRDSTGDVARNAPAKTRREDPETIVAANLKRAQEAARSLEEYSKLISPKAAFHFGEIRFRLYDIEKDIAAAARIISAAPPLPRGPFLYAVADYNTLAGPGGKSFRFLKDLLSAGTGMIQLREKNSHDMKTLKAAKKVAEYISKESSLFVINDRADIAIAAGADAVHIGQDDLPVEEIRSIAGGGIRIGFSTHTFSQAVKGIEARPDYISVGPIFSSSTKPEKKPVGLKLLKRVKKEAGRIPIVAIGGVTPNNLARVYEAGASGAAMVTALSQTENLNKILEDINDIIKSFK